MSRVIRLANQGPSRYVHLRGGPADGERVEIPNDARRVYVPVAAKVSLQLEDATDRVVVYGEKSGPGRITDQYGGTYWVVLDEICEEFS